METVHPFEQFCAAFKQSWRNGLQLHVEIESKQVTAFIGFRLVGKFDRMVIGVNRVPLSHAVERLVLIAVPGEGATILQTELGGNQPLVGVGWARLAAMPELFGLIYCRMLIRYAAGEELPTPPKLLRTG